MHELFTYSPQLFIVLLGIGYLLDKLKKFNDKKNGNNGVTAYQANLLEKITSFQARVLIVHEQQNENLKTIIAKLTEMNGDNKEIKRELAERPCIFNKPDSK